MVDRTRGWAASLVLTGSFAFAGYAKADDGPSPSSRMETINAAAVVMVRTEFTCAAFVGNQQALSTTFASHGSGFFVSPDGYILTNAHVVSDAKEGDQAIARSHARFFLEELIKHYQLSREQVIAMLQRDAFSVRCQHKEVVVMHNAKTYNYEIKAYGTPTGQGANEQVVGKDFAVLKIEVKNAPTIKLGSSSEVHVGDKVWVLGFPGASESHAVAGSERFQPTSSSGEINRVVTSQDGAPLLQTDAANSHGSSGGPVLNEKGEVVGQLTFGGEGGWGRAEDQRFSYCVASDTAKEFVRQAGAEPKPSIVDDKWRKGLENYWAHHFSAAKQDFQEVLDLFPDHGDAERLKAECADRIAKGEDKSGLTWLWLTLGVVVVGGAGAGIAMSQKKKPPQQQGYPQTAAAGYGQMPAAQSYPQLPQGGAGGYPPGSDPGGYPAQGGYPAPSGGAPAAGYAAAPAPTAAGYPAAALAPTQLGQAYSPQSMQSLGPGAPAPSTGRIAKTMAYDGPPGGMGAKLAVTGGVATGRELLIGGGVVIGRDPAKCQLVVEDAGVSGEHVWIGPLHGAIMARDLGSTNGTFVNDQLGARITEVAVKHGDVVTVGTGGTKLAVVFPG